MSLTRSCALPRNATCQDSRCICSPGSCAVDGKCGHFAVLPPPTAPAASHTAPCSKHTGGTCNSWPCLGWRNAQCRSNITQAVVETAWERATQCGAGQCSCTCAPDQCASRNGTCISYQNCAFDHTSDCAPLPGQCRVLCHLFQATAGDQWSSSSDWGSSRPPCGSGGDPFHALKLEIRKQTR